MNTLTLFDAAARDARHALRTIRTNPGFSAAVLLSLGLGIGANMAIFSVVDAVLIRPLAYPESGELVSVLNSAVLHGQSFPDMPLSMDMYRAIHENARAFRQFGVWSFGATTITGAGEPEQTAVVTMTDGVMPALGVPPLFGRWFSAEDVTPGTPPVAILSYGYWQRKFGGDPHIVGRSIVADFIPRRVIGVMPRQFQFLDLAPGVFLPQRISATPDSNEYNHSGIARLKPGITLARANDDIGRALAVLAEFEISRRVMTQFHIKPALRALKHDVVGDIGPVLWILTGSLGLVLLLVCANVANLVQVRTQARRQEFAIRAALGAGWTRIAWELLVENLTFGLLGGAVGLLFAGVILRLLVAHGPTALPRLDEISLDGASVAFALACSVGAAILCGSAAIYQCGRPARLENARGSSAGRGQLRAQNAFVVAQVALALILVVAAGLMIRSFVALRAVRPGFTHPEQVETIRISIPGGQVPEPERVALMQHELVTRLLAIPGVSGAAFADGLPMELENSNGVGIAVEGKTAPDEIPPNRAIRRISPGLFAVQGTRLIAGRDFTWSDLAAPHQLVMVSENMARENWGSPRNALGKRIRSGRNDVWREVIGVVENVYEDGVQQEPPPIVYYGAGVEASVEPGHAGSIRRAVSLAVRSSRAGTESFLRELAAAIHAVNPDMPLAKVRTMGDVYRQSLARSSFALVLLGVAGAMSLLLAIVGVYGVLAYAVAQRRREVGIRVALGAEPRMVRSLFLREGLALTAIGGVIGIAAAAGLSRYLSSLLFAIQPLDPATYAAAAAIIVCAAIGASYIPARRAASADPVETLRSE